LNLLSSVAAFVFAAGVLVFVFDALRPRWREGYAKRNPWNAGTLEWMTPLPQQQWGARSIPEVKSRYPLWDQPDIVQKVDAGQYYLPDAEEGKRETLITSVLDGEPMQCLRLPGDSFLPMTAAAFVGGAFILTVF